MKIGSESWAVCSASIFKMLKLNKTLLFFCLIFGLFNLAWGDQIQADKIKTVLELKGLVEKNALAEADKLLNDNPETAKEILLEFILKEGANDLRDWANWQYYNFAAKNQGIEKAISKLEDLSVENPQNTGLKMSIAEGYLRLKEIKKCIKLYEELNKAYPQDKQIFEKLINYQMNNKDFSRVIERLEPLVKADPKNSPYTETLGFAYLNSNRKKDYLKLYKGIADKDSKGIESRTQYAWALMTLGKKQEAIKEWGKVLKLNPASIRAREEIASIQYSLGNKKAAEKEFQEIKKIDPIYEPSILDAKIK